VAAKSKGKKILFCFAHFLREKREKKSFEKLTGHFGNETGPPTADRRPPTADRRPPTADRRPPTADRRPPTADRRPHFNSLPR